MCDKSFFEKCLFSLILSHSTLDSTPPLPPPLIYQGCRSSSPATCRASSYRRLLTTLAASPKASLSARMGTAGASAVWTFRSVTVHTRTWTLWRKTCFASERPGGWPTRSLRNQVSRRTGIGMRTFKKGRNKNTLRFWWIHLKCFSGIFASQKMSVCTEQTK